MARNRMKFNDTALQLLLSEPGVRADMDRRANNVLDEARATAPVLSGEYRDRLHIERSIGLNGAETLTVTAGTDHDIYVEADHGTLAKALDAAAD